MDEAPVLKIYKASAGSGKTYTLAWEFLSLLFSNPYNYKAILAVTFTNKATAEMKSRILDYLYSLINDEKPEFLDKLCETTGKKPEVIRKNAKLILTNILNDFSHFSISTIDSFVQKVIRSFAFEAGLPTGLYTELNYKTVLSEAVDTLLREINMKKYAELKKWVLDQAFIKLQEGKDWKTSRDLTELGEELFKEKFQGISKEMAEKISDKEFMKDYLNELHNIKSGFETEVTRLASEIENKINEYGIKQDDLAGKSKSPLVNIFKLINCKDFKVTTVQTVIKNIVKIESIDQVLHKSAKADRKRLVTECYSNGLEDVIDALKTQLTQNAVNYYTAIEVLARIRSLAVISDISKRVEQISHDKNIFLLANANVLLKSIIDENDTPFIYEKTGTRYRHYMIDEFQDTSNLQWNNFKPLVSNGLSEGNDSLIVGDVKQSIYRWRNSDWKLLDNKVSREFSQYSNVISLEFNYRSLANIINFNNFIFKTGSKILQDHFIESTKENQPEESMLSMISNAYSDVVQNIPPSKKESGGYAEMKFIEVKNENEYEEPALSVLLEKINKLKEAGYEYSDICILVREKKEGRIVSEFLMGNDNGIPVISDESLFLESSPAVNIVINRLKYLQDPANEVLKTHIKLYKQILSDRTDYADKAEVSFDVLPDTNFINNNEIPEQTDSLKGKPLFELTEALIRDLPDWLRKQQAPYLKELLNKIQDFITSKSVNVSDFIEWWEDKGKTSSITTPDGQNAIKIMTIHKSKGLEFKIVIIPYCHWDLDSSKNNTLLWCEPDSEPFNKLDIVPVRYGSALARTIFSKDYYRERLMQYIDNLNLLYVAFTRAAEGIFTISKLNPDKTATVGDLLYKCITGNAPEMQDHIVSQEGIFDEDNNTFTFGSLKPETVETSTQKEQLFHSFETIPFSKRVRIHTDSDAMAPDVLETYRVHGKLMHLLFERIKTTKDIDPAVESLIIEGKLSTDKGNELKEKITSLLAQQPYKDWFSGKYEIRNETSILKKEGISRPDRVMRDKNNVVTVVDYKFGKVRNNKYRKQVSNYMDLLKEMGYKDVKGYIWYINNEVLLEEVKAG